MTSERKRPFVLAVLLAVLAVPQAQAATIGQGVFVQTRAPIRAGMHVVGAAVLVPQAVNAQGAIRISLYSVRPGERFGRLAATITRTYRGSPIRTWGVLVHCRRTAKPRRWYTVTTVNARLGSSPIRRLHDRSQTAKLRCRP